MQLSVLIPSLNGRSLLEESLPALFHELQDIPSYEVIIIDNNSIDTTAQLLKEQYPEVKYIQLSNNKGFTGAVNAGAQAATGQYLLILNNDCQLQRHTLRQLLKTLEPGEVVATQPSILTPAGTVESMGYKVELTIGKATVLKEFEPRYWADQRNLFKTGTLYGLSGTCLLIQAKVFQQLSRFDERFHSYLEDIDLCIRLAQAGYHFQPTPAAKCVHQHMATSKKMGSYKEQHDFTNWIRIILKNYPFSFILKHVGSLTLERGRNFSGLLKKMMSSTAASH